MAITCRGGVYTNGAASGYVPVNPILIGQRLALRAGKIIAENVSDPAYIYWSQSPTRGQRRHS